MSNDPVPYFRPDINQHELSLVEDCLASGWLTSGPRVDEFQSSFAAAVGAEHAVALNSATAALHLALLAHEIGPGDDVIVPTLTFAATAEVVLAVGANLVLVDVEPETLQIDVARVREAISTRTRAVMPVHYGGSECNMVDLLEARDRYKQFVVIEDAAHAFPTRTTTGSLVGASSDATCFSFYANKTITTGEGGMLTTPSEPIAERVRSLSLHGLSRGAWNRFETRAAWDYDIVRPGWKYNMTDVAASLGIGQLERAEQFAARRRAIHRAYDDAFADLVGISPRDAGPVDSTSAHLYVVRVDSDVLGKDRDDLIAELTAQDIGTSVHYRPLHMHSYYRERFGFQDSDFPAAAAAFERIVSLPIYPSMTDSEVATVIEAVRRFAAG